MIATHCVSNKSETRRVGHRTVCSVVVETSSDVQRFTIAFDYSLGYLVAPVLAL